MIVEWIWVLIPLAGIFIGGLAIYLEHKQKMALIKKGISPEEEEQKKAKRDKFTGGLVMMGIGAAFLLSGFGIWTEFMQEYGLVGLVCGFIGIALVLSHITEKK